MIATVAAFAARYLPPSTSSLVSQSTFKLALQEALIIAPKLLHNYRHLRHASSLLALLLLLMFARVRETFAGYMLIRSEGKNSLQGFRLLYSCNDKLASAGFARVSPLVNKEGFHRRSLLPTDSLIIDQKRENTEMDIS